MSSVQHALETVRRVVDKLGTAEAARLAGIPYTTLHEARRRNFTGPSIETFQKIAAFAERYEVDNGDTGEPAQDAA